MRDIFIVQSSNKYVISDSLTDHSKITPVAVFSKKDYMNNIFKNRISYCDIERHLNAKFHNVDIVFKAIN